MAPVDVSGTQVTVIGDGNTSDGATDTGTTSGSGDGGTTSGEGGTGGHR